MRSRSLARWRFNLWHGPTTYRFGHPFEREAGEEYFKDHRNRARLWASHERAGIYNETARGEQPGYRSKNYSTQRADVEPVELSFKEENLPTALGNFMSQPPRPPTATASQITQGVLVFVPTCFVLTVASAPNPMAIKRVTTIE